MHYHIFPKLLSAFVISTFLVFCSQANKEKTPRQYHGQGIDAYFRKDYTVFLKSLKKAQKLAPSNPKIAYDLARAYALNGNKDSAIKYLEQAVEVGYYINPQHNTDFISLGNTDGFKGILKKIKKMKVSTKNSTIAFTIPEKDLIAEGIAYDPIENTFYLGSVHKRKIIRITKNGIVNDFTTETQDGLWSITGMKVDAKRRTLWVNTCTTFAMKGLKSEQFGLTGVFKYNLKNGKLIKKYLLDERPISHLFNDLVINSQGDVFITDSLFGAVFTIQASKDRLDLFVKTNRLTYPNGIALSQDEKRLFVAHTEGTSEIDVETKTCSIISHSKDISLCLIDGLYLYKNSLIAIQNDNWQRHVVQLILALSTNGLDQNNSSYHVKKARIIESGNPLFNVPTTGVIVGDMFYYIANSQINEFDNERGMFPMEKLRGTVILKSNLST